MAEAGRCLSALTVGGSDSAGGAGIQADLKTFQHFGVHGASVITCVTAQNSRGVSHVEPLSGYSVGCQLEAVVSDLAIPALKTGMLYSADLVEAVADGLRSFPGSIVVDPVMVSRAGSRLLRDDAVSAYAQHLFRLATLLTPNLQEAALLTGREIRGKADVECAAESLLERGPKAVLIKGGGLPELAGQDFFNSVDGPGVWRSQPAIATPHTHGTGCTLSAAITAALVQGASLADAVIQAKEYLNDALRRTVVFGDGPGCVGHRLEPGT